MQKKEILRVGNAHLDIDGLGPSSCAERGAAAPSSLPRAVSVGQHPHVPHSAMGCPGTPLLPGSPLPCAGVRVPGIPCIAARVKPRRAAAAGGADVALVFWLRAGNGVRGRAEVL